MVQTTGSYYSEDRIYREINSMDPALFSTGTVLYEVLRVWQGKALFLEDHVSRLQQSIKLSGYTYSISTSYIGELLDGLVKINHITTGNVKINVLISQDLPVVYTFFIPHSYPDAEMYQFGVTAGFFNASRSNPNIKKLNPEIIRQVEAVIKSHQFYDVLLVGDDGLITEGSKTNVFFIQNNQVYTAPGNMVLRGITRGKVIRLCKDLGIALHEKSLYKENLSAFNAAFFSGTSPKILPIRNIQGLNFRTDDPVMRTLMNAYDDMINSYLQQN